MTNGNDPVLVYTTFESADDAKKLGRKLVEAGLAACVNIFPTMISVFEWEGALDEAQEAVMIIKTRKGIQSRALSQTKEWHPYDTPALLVIEPSDADAEFAAWIAGQTGAGA